MSGLSMMESRLPPGFRFHPRDDELVCDYLEMKINPRGGDGVRSFTTSSIFMIDVNLNHCEPWDLPEIACVGGKAWYFFSLRDRKYATGQRTNRATQSGYWKATGKDRPVMRKGVLVGMRKTLVFYQGRAPKGKKTDWIMHEFRAESNATADPPKVFVKEDWVLCRVLLKHRNMAPTPAPVTFNSFQSHAGSSSSSLPPLTDSTHITVDRAHGDYCQISMNLQEFGQELQVPCFSNSLQGPMSAMVHQPAPQPQPARHFPSDAGPCLTRPLVNSERNMIKVVLSQFAKLEEGQRREASTNLEDGVVESYFSTEGGLENMW